MHIKIMKDDDLEDVIRIDHSAFEREEKRTLENCKALKTSNPERCFAIEDKNKILGYKRLI
ncbi:MAG: hypothetical protein HZC47_08815 [Methanobacterium sp.]|uniref:hypothetical protein n=1 Tax=Methanobacterium sp. TaxID=2164 RepID=UPI003D65E6E1|nr:hypothetical protein [Methanobacterium sp.]